MNTATSCTGPSLAERLGQDGFAFVPGTAMRPALDAEGGLDDWEPFAESWNHLALDRYMADGGRYRRRRHALFQVSHDGAARPLAHGPHYQSRDYNRLNGGIARWFEPVQPQIRDGSCLRTVLAHGARLFGQLAPDVRSWHTEVHQFRIEALSDRAGLPTPEGMHRDGVDYVLVLLIQRWNIASGTTSIHAPDGHELGCFTLSRPLDAALVDDARVYHGVTAVQAIDPALPAYRDVLVVTYRRPS